MPKDEFDFDDPMELSGVALLTHEDTTDAMAECFIEEFMRLGYNPKQVLALFRNPHYLGMNMVLQNRGEQFVRGYIGEIFARWGRPVVWENHNPPARTAPAVPEKEGGSPVAAAAPAGGEGEPEACTHPARAPQTIELDADATDPMGAAIPQLSI